MKWIVGSTVVAIIVGVAFTITVPAQTITPDQAILKLFPPETQGIAFIDVAGLRNAPLAQDMLGKFGPGSPEGLFGEFVAATGFVIERDLDQVTVAKVGSRQTIAVVRARLDKFKAEQFLNEKSPNNETYMGRAIYRNNDGAVTFVDDLIILGHYDSLKRAIERTSLPGSPSLKADLSDAIRTIETGNQVWGVGGFSADELPAGAPAPARDLLKALQGGTYQMRVDRDIHARATANFADADSARNLSDMARGFIAVAKLQVAKEQDLLHLLDGVQVSNSGSSVTLNIDAPGDLIKKLRDLRMGKTLAQ